MALAFAREQGNRFRLRITTDGKLFHIYGTPGPVGPYGFGFLNRLRMVNFTGAGFRSATRQSESAFPTSRNVTSLVSAFIEWEPTPQSKVRVLNDTADYYRHFDATAHAEFLYQCVEQTVDRDLAQEFANLEAYDRFSAGIQTMVDMPDSKVALVYRFLNQGKGQLSKRARTNEFSALTDEEVRQIEELHRENFAGISRQESQAAPE